MRHTNLLLGATVLIGAAITVTPSHAQTATSDSVRQALASIRAGTFLRIETTAGKRDSGVLSEPIGSSIALSYRGVRRTPVADVRATWKAKTHGVQGALLGGLLGLILGPVLGDAVFSGPGTSTDASSVWAGGLIGMGAGALLGALTHSWTLVHESRTP